MKTCFPFDKQPNALWVSPKIRYKLSSYVYISFDLRSNLRFNIDYLIFLLILLVIYLDLYVLCGITEILEGINKDL